MDGGEEEETDIHLLLDECLELALDFLAADGLGGYLGAAVFSPEGKTDDRSWKRVLILCLLEPSEVQGLLDFARDIFQSRFRAALVKEVALGVKHDHGVFREYLWVVRDL